MNKLERYVICIVVLSLLTTVSVTPQTQPQLNDEFCAKFSRTDHELNTTYNQVLAIYKDDIEFIESIKKAQRAWIIFRDYHVDSLYPRSRRGEYGSVKPMCRCNALAELTAERTKMLRKWIDGIDEGDVCAGSIKSKADMLRNTPK